MKVFLFFLIFLMPILSFSDSDLNASMRDAEQESRVLKSRLFQMQNQFLDKEQVQDRSLNLNSENIFDSFATHSTLSRSFNPNSNYFDSLMGEWTVNYNIGASS